MVVVCVYTILLKPVTSVVPAWWVGGGMVVGWWWVGGGLVVGWWWDGGGLVVGWIHTHTYTACTPAKLI